MVRRHRPSTLARMILAGLVVSVFSSPGTSVAADPFAGWQPGLAFQLAGLPQQREATAESDTSGFQDGEELGFPFAIGGSVELASPVLLDGPVPARVFVHAGASAVIEPEGPVTSTGDPGSAPFQSPIQPAPESIENVGATVRAQSKPWLLSGGVGAIFEIEALDRTVHLRPSLEWMYQRETIRTILGGGENEDPNPAPPGFLCNPCRTLFIDAEREKGYHSLGLGLAAEVDGPRHEDFELRFFASFTAFRILGDRSGDLSSRATWQRTDGDPTTRSPAETTFDTTHDRDPWHYRFGLGARLVWNPR